MTSSYRMRASTSGASASKWKYDVFLSFRGEDTRDKFTDHLYDKLQWRGIKAFRDDPQLERGTAISPELMAAIEESRFAVVVLSPNYASSTWCLLELAKIVQCIGERGQILPIFYEVDPSDVRYQTGSFAEAFGEHEDKFGEDSTKVQEWRDALTKVANLAGWTSNNYSLSKRRMKRTSHQMRRNEGCMELSCNGRFHLLSSPSSCSLPAYVGRFYNSAAISSL